MSRKALIVTSVRRCFSAQETLRVQDTASALRRMGWEVSILTPSESPILAATLAHDVRVFTLPRLLPARRLGMFLRGLAIAANSGCSVVHGFDEGAGVAMMICRAMRRRLAYIAEVHNPETVGGRTVRDAAAVIVPDGETLSRFSSPPPLARVSVLPDPHAELAGDALTAAEFGDAIDGIYTYVLRIHPEVDR